MIEATDDDLNEVEKYSWVAEDGTAVYSTIRERQLVMRIRRLEKQYTELVSTTEDTLKTKDAILEKEREWTRALTDDCGKLIAENDALRDNAAVLEKMYRKIQTTLRLGASQVEQVEMVQNSKTLRWEKKS